MTSAPIPSWVEAPDRDKIADASKAKARKLFMNKDLENEMTYLCSRWMDERGNENIADYAERLKPIVEKGGVKFVKATKRPFGFICCINELYWHFTMNSKIYTFTFVPFQKAA